MIRRYLAATLVAVCLIAALLDGYGVHLLRSHGLFARLVAVDDWEAIRQAPDGEALEVLQRAFPEGDHRALLRAVMDLVARVDSAPDGGPLVVYEHVRKGGGSLCGGMAALYKAVLDAHGIPARWVALKRDLFDIYDTHVTVEVLLAGRWVVFDPTFHASFEKDGRLLGARDLQAAMLDGSAARVRPIFHGEVRYPARLDRYYIHWAPLFNHVLIDDTTPLPLLARKTPLRYWLGPRKYYKRLSERTPVPYVFQDRLLFGVLVVLPTIAGGTGGAALLLVAWPFLRGARWRGHAWRRPAPEVVH